MKNYTIKSTNPEFYEKLIRTMPINPITMSIRVAPESQKWSTYFHGLKDNNPIYKHDFNVRFTYDKNRDFFVPHILNPAREIENEDATFILENFFTYKPYIVEYYSRLEEEKAFPRFKEKLLDSVINAGYHINNARFDFSYNPNKGIIGTLIIDANSGRSATLDLYESETIDDLVTEKNNVLREWFTSFKEEN